jgi:hypothetical protein
VEACFARVGYVAGEGSFQRIYAELCPQADLVIVRHRCQMAPSTAHDSGLHLECLNSGLRQSGLTAVMDSFAGLIGLMIAKTYFSA